MKMTKKIEVAVTRIADNIRPKIYSGTLYGEPIDKDNVDQVMVAAYLLGKSGVLTKKIKE